MTVKVHLSIGLTADIDSAIEVEDSATDKEIESEVRDWALDHVEWSWERPK